MDSNSVGKENDIYIYDRSRADLTGISEVIEFSENNITVCCKSGNISIDGSALKISSFDSESCRLSLYGNIDSVIYFGDPADTKKTRRKLFG